LTRVISVILKCAVTYVYEPFIILASTGSVKPPPYSRLQLDFLKYE